MAIFEELLWEWVVYLSIIVSGLLVYFIGNMLVGKSGRGGERFVLLIAGLACSTLGAFVLKSGEEPKIASIILGGGILTVEIAFIACGSFARNKTVEKRQGRCI